MSGKHLYGQMWINVHLFFRPQIKPDLLPNRFLVLTILITEGCEWEREKRERRERGRQREIGRGRKGDAWREEGERNKVEGLQERRERGNKERGEIGPNAVGQRDRVRQRV